MATSFYRIAAASVIGMLALDPAAKAQGWANHFMYESGPDGTPPVMYCGADCGDGADQDPYAQPAYQPPVMPGHELDQPLTSYPDRSPDYGDDDGD